MQSQLDRPPSRVLLRLPNLGGPAKAAAKIATPSMAKPLPAKPSGSATDAPDHAAVSSGTTAIEKVERRGYRPPLALLAGLTVVLGVLWAISNRQQNVEPAPPSQLKPPDVELPLAPASQGEALLLAPAQSSSEALSPEAPSQVPSPQASTPALPAVSMPDATAVQAELRIERLPTVNTESLGESQLMQPAADVATAVTSDQQATPGMARLERRIENTKTEVSHDPTRPGLY